MKSKFLIGFVLLMISLTTLLSLVPGHNGDMPFYIASVIEKERGPQKDVLQKTKEVLEKELPAAEFVKHVKRIDEAPGNILDFYHIKPLYITMVAGLHQLGFSYIVSTLLPSIIAYFFLGILTFAWASRTLPPVQGFLVSALLMLIYPAVILVRLSTPDALSNLIILAILYLIYFEKNKWLVLALLFISLWVRMDNIVFLLVILTGLRYWPEQGSENKLGPKIFIVLLLAAVGMVVAMNYFLEADFWWFKRVTYAFSPPAYGRQLLVYFLSFSKSFSMAIIIMFVLIHYRQKFKLTEKSGFLFLVIMGIFIARLILFPSLEDRFVAAYYIAAILLLAEKCIAQKQVSG
ncbi:MAG TPA: hypothetical protein VK543_14160 [Puia sp.]|nr:hypothetical protein [Puia sp.]